MEKFYRALEDRFRGSKDEVKNKMKIYLEVLKNYKNKKILDLGCGRGEFLEILKENDFKYLYGVDINKEMIKNLKNFTIYNEDVLEFLKRQKRNSFSVITSFHLIEHLNFDDIFEIVKLSFDILDDNGILILETPNPENIKVSIENFYLDFTHKKPIPQELLKFLLEYFGFEARVLRLNDSSIKNRIKDIIENVSPDYAVIGFKNKNMINEEFFKRGVSLDLAMFAFEERIKNLEGRVNKMELKIENKKLKSENEKLKSENEKLKSENEKLKSENEKLKIELKELENIKRLYEDVINSKSWRITKPLREITNFFRNKKRKIILNITTNEETITLSNEETIPLSKRASEIYNLLKKEIKGKK